VSKSGLNFSTPLTDALSGVLDHNLDFIVANPTCLSVLLCANMFTQCSPKVLSRMPSCLLGYLQYTNIHHQVCASGLVMIIAPIAARSALRFFESTMYFIGRWSVLKTNGLRTDKYSRLCRSFQWRGKWCILVRLEDLRKFQLCSVQGCGEGCVLD
jgi:hypothetical protein